MTMDASRYPNRTVRRKSLSRLVEFEDLMLLDGGDLRSVLSQVEPVQLVQALAGVGTGLRRGLLGKLPVALAARLEAEVKASPGVSPEVSHLAQRALVDTLCRLGRGGQVAFDDPYDMFPESLVA
jgi:flagellar motor switch protein FliG